jgi:glycosyltransferase involved in cell wall biosynthesis
MGITIILPVYNEEFIVTEIIARICLVMEQQAEPYEVVVINDGSTDKTLKRIESIQMRNIKLINSIKNKGYGYSLSMGVLCAQFDVIVILDADGTYRPEVLPKMLAELGSSAMLVGARRMTRQQQGLLRWLAQHALRSLAQCLTGHCIPDLNSGQRVFRREPVVKLLPILPHRFSWTSTVTISLLILGYPVRFMPITYSDRVGCSKFHPVLDTLRMVRCIFVAAYWSKKETNKRRSSRM